MGAWLQHGATRTFPFWFRPAGGLYRHLPQEEEWTWGFSFLRSYGTKEWIDLNQLLQVEMFLNNTLKLWEFAEGKLDSPFLCRDIQVAHFLQGYLKDTLCCPVVSKVVKDFAKLSNSLEVCQLWLKNVVLTSTHFCAGSLTRIKLIGKKSDSFEKRG